MEDDNSDIFSVMKEFDDFVKDFTENAGADIDTPDMDINEISNLSLGELDSLKSEDCLSRSYKISAYAMFIRNQINQNQARLNWCEDSINRILSEEWDNYDQFMKFEVKRQSIIRNNSFAAKVEKLRSRLKARSVILDDRLRDLRDMSQTMFELGKRRGYNERS